MKFSLKKMWGKVGKDALKTGIAGGLAGGGVITATGSEMGLQQALIALGTALVSSTVTGVFNWIKHRQKG